MSKATELAEAEAARVEAESPDDDDDAAEEEERDEEAAPSEPAPETTEVSAEPEQQPFSPEAMERELRRHEHAWAALVHLPPEELNACPTCGGIGFTEAKVEPPPEYAWRTDTEPCPECRALGMMVTGSKVPGQELLPCPRCTGAGYITKMAQVTQLPPTTVTQEPPEVMALRAAGYTVVPPFVPAQGQAQP